MSVDQITSQDAFRLTLASPASVEGSEVVLTAENLVGPGVTPAAVQAAQDAADQAALDAAAAQADANEREVSIVVANLTAGTSTFVPAPVTGTFLGFCVSASVQPSARILFDSLIGGLGVDGSSVEVLSTDAAGTVKTATALTPEAVTAGTTSVEIVTSTANVTAGNAVVVLRFVKA